MQKKFVIDPDWRFCLLMSAGHSRLALLKAKEKLKEKNKKREREFKKKVIPQQNVKEMVNVPPNIAEEMKKKKRFKEALSEERNRPAEGISTEDHEKRQIRQAMEAKLNDEQRIVAKKVADGKNVFITGLAGTGKSFLLEYLVLLLKTCKDPFSVAVTASTGVSACNIGGETLHRFSGAGASGDKHRDQIVHHILLSEDGSNNLKTVESWIIDEISMVGRTLFEALDLAAKKIRQSSAPFGGIQVIACGDFMQLSPVKDEFCFKSVVWSNTFSSQNSVVLKRIYRQSDKEFLEILKGVRNGTLAPELLQKLNKMCVR